MRVVRADHAATRAAVLAEAAAILRRGGLVAFPTETVYGLGANALDESAVRRIYEAKGRPPLNPLIVHVATMEAARALALDWTSCADAIARAFWPGPVTIVVKKRDIIPDIVTAGTDSVGVRVPAHPVALALLEEAGIPVAAPSANLSMQLSPTTAQHVARGLGDRVELILDGGATSVGIESTVVDARGAVPHILRPGMIAREAIARVAGAADMGSRADREAAPRSPGLLGKHYAPRAAVRLVARDAIAEARREAEGRVGAMTFGRADADVDREMPRDPAAYARVLYATLHALDDAGCDVILIERPPAEPEWAAITDRLERAAG
jgi:L-threonylcarbamoyladenylate synthase